MRQAILKLLLEREGQYVSGEEISTKLSVSRTAIWKQINIIKEKGYIIESSPRVGYRLLERPDILVPEELKILLPTPGFVREIHVYDQLSSTNDLAKKMAAEGAGEGTVVIAEQQLKGRGRMGRPWFSRPGSGLWFSLILRPDIPPYQAPRLIFVIAVAVCRALRLHTALEAAIKWPNDILISGKKVCGILTEMSAEIDKLDYVVAGIGINVRFTELSPELRETAIALEEAGAKNLRRTNLLMSVLKELETEYKSYLTAGFPGVLKRWRQYDCTLGHEVMVSSQEESYSGRAVDINEEGCLMVKTTQGEIHTVVVGDVSLRRISK